MPASFRASESLLTDHTNPARRGSKSPSNLSDNPNSLDPASQAEQTCANCATQTTPLWRRSESGAILCNACSLYLKVKGCNRPVSLKTDVIKHRNRPKSNKNRSNTLDSLDSKRHPSPDDVRPAKPTRPSSSRRGSTTNNQHSSSSNTAGSMNARDTSPKYMPPSPYTATYHHLPHSRSLSSSPSAPSPQPLPPPPPYAASTARNNPIPELDYSAYDGPPSERSSSSWSRDSTSHHHPYPHQTHPYFNYAYPYSPYSRTPHPSSPYSPRPPTASANANISQYHHPTQQSHSYYHNLPPYPSPSHVPSGLEESLSTSTQDPKHDANWRHPATSESRFKSLARLASSMSDADMEEEADASQSQSASNDFTPSPSPSSHSHAGPPPVKKRPEEEEDPSAPLQLPLSAMRVAENGVQSTQSPEAMDSISTTTTTTNTAAAVSHIRNHSFEPDEERGRPLVRRKTDSDDQIHRQVVTEDEGEGGIAFLSSIAALRHSVSSGRSSSSFRAESVARKFRSARAADRKSEHSSNRRRRHRSLSVGLGDGVTSPKSLYNITATTPNRLKQELLNDSDWDRNAVVDLPVSDVRGQGVTEDSDDLNNKSDDATFIEELQVCGVRGLNAQSALALLRLLRMRFPGYSYQRGEWIECFASLSEKISP